MRASVHRWSCQPAASGPAPSAASSTASCPSSSRQRAACPRDATPGRPPASQARRHRRTDRSLTRSSAATTAVGARCPNLSTASRRTCSRRLRPSAVNPPPCAYRIRPAYRRKPHLSASGHHQLKIGRRSEAEPVRREALRCIPGPAGKDWRNVLGSNGLPDAERLSGTRACQETGGRVQVSGTVHRETRAIW
jgi:hypothetical protein